MRKHSVFLFALVAAALPAGCDGGDSDPPDPRVWEGSDASVWQPLAIDAGAPRDGGSCDMSFPALSGDALPACEAETQACILACATDDQPCRDACTLGDGYANPLVTCTNCLTFQFIACADVSGCHDAVSAFLCCNAVECPEGSAEDCASSRCPGELQGLFSCLGTTAGACVDYADPTWGGACFAGATGADAGPMDVDAGPGDAGPTDDAGMPADGGMS